MAATLFHLAFPVADIPRTKQFYAEGLGCEVGRETKDSVILNLYGHQIVAHVTTEPLTPQSSIYPRHFGLVFTQEADWEALLARAQSNQLTFYQHPKRRFPDSPLEHRTFFLQDPFGNFLEFKVYRYAAAIFGEREHQQIGDRAPT
ncbi:MAG: VOC family protein [Cyanobacteria bacterium]|nr:VOC family protein [Cyanobacteriota bacterium]MDW8201561.1 VOC family protein [Cyanobacteriota bacterium SKYGB_h_bin112]